VYDEKERPRVWTPDFYIPKLRMYIEVCGTDEFDYEYRKKIYYKNGYRVAFIQVYKETWKKFLVNMIMDIEEKRHGEVTKMIKNFSSN
jgi:DNA-binding SARP family transcriptional activator